MTFSQRYKTVVKFKKRGETLGKTFDIKRQFTVTSHNTIYTSLSSKNVLITSYYACLIPGPVFMKGLGQGLDFKLIRLSQVSAPKLLRFCLRLSGIHKEFKTGLRLSQGLYFKTGKWEA